MSYTGKSAAGNELRGDGTFVAAAGGSVTSVGLTMPTEFSVANSPVTGSATLAVTSASQAANKVYAAPSGSSGAMSARLLVAADIPNLDAAKITSGTLDTARLGSGTANAKSFLRGDQTWSKGLYTIWFGTTAVHNPADATTYYIGPPGQAATTTPGTRRIPILYSGTLVGAVVFTNSVTTAGSNESWTINFRLNNTTSTAIASVGTAATNRVFSNQAMSVSVAAGDYFEIESASPTWATNPQGTLYYGYVVIAA